MHTVVFFKLRMPVTDHPQVLGCVVGHQQAAARADAYMQRYLTQLSLFSRAQLVERCSIKGENERHSSFQSKKGCRR